MPVSIPGLTTLRGRDVGFQRINVEFNLGETNPVGNKRIFSVEIQFKFEWICLWKRT